MIKLIATDMDGTLLNENGEINKEFKEVFNKLKEKKIMFCAASGRQYYNLLKNQFDQYIFLNFIFRELLINTLSFNYIAIFILKFCRMY